MKTFFILFVFTFLMFSNVNGASLTVYLSECRSNCDKQFGKVKIYRAGKLIKKSRLFKTELFNIESGIYNVEYNTLTEKKRYIEIEIRERENKTITLCFDDFEYDQKVAPAAIDLLKVDQRIVIYRQCRKKGRRINDSVCISKSIDGFFLQYQDVNRKLNDVEVEIIREFEYFLLYFSRKGRFKRKDFYTFQHADSRIKRKDPTGKWNGFHYLLIDLKLRDADSCD